MNQTPQPTQPTPAPAHTHASPGDDGESSAQRTQDAKQRQLDAYRVAPEGDPLTTDQGVPVASDDDSLKAGERGPTLMEDFQLREKITHFDHERIPERVVHARGAGAYGYFELYDSLAEFAAAFGDAVGRHRARRRTAAPGAR